MEEKIMKNCPKCGTELGEGVAFCSNCGAVIEQQQPNYQGEPQGKTANAGEKAKGIFQKLFDFSDKTNEFVPEDIEKNKVLSLFSYLGILFLIPLFAAKDSKFARFHTNQGLVLFLVDIVLYIVNTVLSVVLGIIPFIGPIIAGILDLVFSLAGILLFAWAIMGIVNAVTGKAKELPFIGKIRILK